jgi:hypothetical protein
VLGHQLSLKIHSNSRFLVVIFSVELFLTKDELNKLMLFEEQCTESYLQKKAKVLSATQEERVKGIAER